MCLLNTNHFIRYQGTQAPSLLDLSICPSDIVNKSSIEISHDLYNSDHCPIFISLSNFGTMSLLTRKYINWGQFSKKINANLLNQGEVSSLDAVTQIFQESANSSSYSFTRSAHTHSSWWDVKCNHLKALKRKLLRKAKSYPSIMNWAAYKEMAAVIRKYVKNYKRSFWEKTCQEAASSHQAFRTVKASLNKDGVPSTYNLVLSSGITLTTLTAEANAIAISLIKKAPEERIPLDFSADYFKTLDDQNLNRPFSFREFHNTLAKTRNKSPRIDQVTKKMLSCLSDENMYKILNLFNNLWSNMRVPESWRIAKIVPILKPGENAAEVTSYRSIALTSVLGKIFEWIILAKLLRIYLENKFFSPFHAGSLPYKGCDSLSAALLNKVLTARALKKFMYGISLDIKAAYYNAWHDGLMLKLLQSGVKGKTALWISFFLQDRKAFVSWRGISSSLFKHERSIPQGSVLWSLLFTIFMNYIYSFLPNDVTFSSTRMTYLF
ncbi:RNA-directed DNA polymerase from mobile element jockey [Araneus ventricosus]|uniref:RNA-directed DNA polymerase from mobile element jockey n=1 Tax=Araneus ventricosus TaxID=182803 RepID=A0A4Y2L0W0_ARAVE|nr:RNA-directed DNA polymerase from mobile element jockey [Araneus ventricosus]